MSNINIFEAYKNDLLKIAEKLKAAEAIDNILSYDYYINYIFREYSEALGFNKKQIEVHLAMLTETPAIDVKTSYFLKELLDSDAEGSSWLVPRLYRKSGLYILGAAPKTFKSLSMYDLTYAITTSGLYLGTIPCTTGKVLFYQCEESKPSIKNRLLTRGFDDNTIAKDNDLLKVERSFNLKSDMEKLKTQIDEFQPSLVIFDSLRAITYLLDVSENSVEFVKYIYALQRLLILNNVTGILIHHKNKTAGAKGLASLSGNLGLGGATDGVVLMSPDLNRSDAIKVETIPRDGSPISFIMKRVKLEGNRWEFILEEELNVDPEVVKIERKALRELANISPEFVDKSTLARAIGLAPSDMKLTIVLDRLLEADILNCRQKSKTNKTFEYSVPSDSPWADSPQFVSQEMQLANDLAKCTSKAEIDDLVADWSDVMKRAVWSLLNTNERDILHAINAGALYKIGDIVTIKAIPESIASITEVTLDELKKLWIYRVEGIEELKDKDLFEIELELIK